MIFMGSDILNN